MQKGQPRRTVRRRARRNEQKRAREIETRSRRVGYPCAGAAFTSATHDQWEGQNTCQGITLPLANGPDTYVDRDIVQGINHFDFVISQRQHAGVSRNAFVMDLLTLIHVSFETNMEGDFYFP